jgi:DNA-binding HxlR family transcriptional regulator
MENGSIPNVLNPNCGSRRVLELIADKWTILVIYVLARGTRRYGQLQREIGGITQKMLTQTLRKMEDDGLITRTIYPVIPPKVEYSLTELGQTLLEPLSAICRWAESHLDEVEQARAKR